MNKTLNIRLASRAVRPSATAGILLTALLLSGCSSSFPDAAVAPAPSTATPASTDTGGPFPNGSEPLLPQADMFNTISAPLMDSYAHFTGEIASMAASSHGGVDISDMPAGKSLGILPDDSPVPVVGRAMAAAPAWAIAKGWPTQDGEWLRVMLPSRVALPSEASADLRPHLNEGTAWIWAKDVVVTNPKTHIVVDKASRTVTVSAMDGTPNADGKVAVTFPAEIGIDVPDGPTFMATNHLSLHTCNGGPSLLLSAQATNADSVAGQTLTFNPTAFMGPGEDCFKPGANDLTSMLPRVIRLSPADDANLAKYTAPGTPVDVISAGQGS